MFRMISFDLLKCSILFIRALKLSKVSARAIWAEVVSDLRSFSSEKALASWAIVYSWNNESAGKMCSGKSPVKKHSLYHQSFGIPGLRGKSFEVDE